MKIDDKQCSLYQKIKSVEDTYSMTNRTDFVGNMNSSNNGTQYEGQVGPLEGSGVPLDTIPAIIVMVFILVINCGVVLLISCNSNLRTTSNIILASLAVSDLLVGLVGIPLLVACSSTFLYPVCLGSTIFFTFISISTVLHLTIMTCDRYIYIMWALRYRDVVNRCRVLALLGLIWVISLTSLVRLSWTWFRDMKTAREGLELVREKETTYFLFNFIVFFFIPLVVMTGLDTHMLLFLRLQCQRIAKENLPAEYVRHEKRMQRRQRRVVMICVFLLLLYITFWTPFFILDLMQYYFSDKIEALPTVAQLIIYYLRLCPPLFNPLAYTLRKPDLKKAVKILMYKTFPRLRSGHAAENRTEQIPLSSRTDL